MELEAHLACVEKVRRWCVSLLADMQDTAIAQSACGLGGCGGCGAMQDRTTPLSGLLRVTSFSW